MGGFKRRAACAPISRPCAHTAHLASCAAVRPHAAWGGLHSWPCGVRVRASVAMAAVVRAGGGGGGCRCYLHRLNMNLLPRPVTPSTACEINRYPVLLTPLPQVVLHTLMCAAKGVVRAQGGPGCKRGKAYK